MIRPPTKSESAIAYVAGIALIAAILGFVGYTSWYASKFGEWHVEGHIRGPIVLVILASSVFFVRWLNWALMIHPSESDYSQQQEEE